MRALPLPSTAATNLQHEIDRAVQRVVEAVAAAQSVAGSGAPGVVTFEATGGSSGALPPLDVYRPVSLPLVSNRFGVRYERYIQGQLSKSGLRIRQTSIQFARLPQAFCRPLWAQINKACVALALVAPLALFCLQACGPAMAHASLTCVFPLHSRLCPADVPPGAAQAQAWLHEAGHISDLFAAAGRGGCAAAVHRLPPGPASAAVGVCPVGSPLRGTCHCPAVIAIASTARPHSSINIRLVVWRKQKGNSSQVQSAGAVPAPLR